MNEWRRRATITWAQKSILWDEWSLRNLCTHNFCCCCCCDRPLHMISQNRVLFFVFESGENSAMHKRSSNMWKICVFICIRSELEFRMIFILFLYGMVSTTTNDSAHAYTRKKKSSNKITWSIHVVQSFVSVTFTCKICFSSTLVHFVRVKTRKSIRL